MQNIIGNVRKAVQEYMMINENDKIAIGLSGGKDSLALLYALSSLRKFYPIHFDVMAITINPGFKDFNTEYLKKICNNLNIEYIVYDSDIYEIVFNIRKEKNPCSLCANLRRGMLCSVAKEHDCNKIALGHHKDDIIETLLLSLLYEGSIHTFSPVTYLDKSDITVIRPLIYLEEKDIQRWIKENDITPLKKCCQIDGYTKREDIKNLILNYSKEIPHIKSNIFGAIERSNIKGWNKEANFNEKK